MNIKYNRTLLTALAVIMIWTAALSSAPAQETPKGTVVLCPASFNKGSETSRKTAVGTVREVLQKAGYTLISDTVAADNWRHMGFPMPSEDSIPSLHDMVRFGQAVNAQYVIAPTFNFHSRSIWVDLGPKTISTATVDITIADVAQNRIVYSRDDVSGRSDEKFNAAKAGADLLLTPLVTAVSGGPKTPHEQRAVRIAVAKALRGWIRHEDAADQHESEQ